METTNNEKYNQRYESLVELLSCGYITSEQFDRMVADIAIKFGGKS